jgi:hypothetical protein
MKNNLSIHQLAMNIGTRDLATNQATVDGLKPQVDMLEANPSLIKGDETEEQMNALLKSGKGNVTRDSFIMHGDPYEIFDPTTGKQKEVNGVPVYGHHYYYVDPKGSAELTQQIQDQGFKIGKFRNPDGSQVKLPVGTTYPVLSMLKQGTENAQIQTAEEILEDHKNTLLGDKAGPRVSLADQVAADPQRMGQAVKDFSRFVGAGEPDQVFGAMMQNGAGQSAALLMKFMGVTPDDVRKAENTRIQEHTEATTKEPQEKALTPEEKADKLADVQLKLSTTAKNNAETKKLLEDDANTPTIAHAIAVGQVSLDRLGYILARKPEIVAAVLKEDPTFDTTKVANYVNTSKDFTSGKTSQQLVNGATALQHLSELRKLNTDQSRIKGTAAYQAYESKMNTVSDELAQFYGTSTIPGIDSFKGTLNATLNRDAAITTQVQSMGDRFDNLENKWTNAAPSTHYQAPMPGISSAAKAVRAQLDPAYASRIKPAGAMQMVPAQGGTWWWVDANKKPIGEVK